MPACDRMFFDPPAPLAQVTLRNPTNSDTMTDVPMLMDTGADISLVPLPYIEKLGIVPRSDVQYELMGFDGNRSIASMVFVEIGWQGRTFKGQFLVIDQEWGILGRNILNLLPILFDGPHTTWEIQRSNS